jgi:adenylate cyclase
VKRLKGMPLPHFLLLHSHRRPPARKLRRAATGLREVADRPERRQKRTMATGDFAHKLGLALKAINLSRSRLAQTAGVDKSVVTRWASGVQVPSDHNLSRLTEAVARHCPGFRQRDWDLDAEQFTHRLDALNAGPSGHAAPSIAVLPFTNMSGDPEQAYFADGLAEDLIAGLSRFSWLFVIARNSSFAFRGEKFDPRAVGARLGVRYLVEGSVRRAGQRLRLSVQLIDAATGSQLWADRYDGSLEDVFDFQDRIVVSLVGALEPKLLATEIARARRKRPDTLDAFDLYLQALSKQAEMSARSLSEAIELLDRAVERSPRYAPALAFAAHSRAIRPMLCYSPDDEKDFREANELLRRALDSDPGDPVALMVAANIPVTLRRDYQAGWDLIDRSLAINPNDARAWVRRGWISAWAGEVEMAMAEFEKGIRLSPLDPLWGGSAKFGKASALCWSGRQEEALSMVRRALQDRPDWSGIHRLNVAVLWLSGRHEDARKAAREYIGMLPGFSLRQARKVSPVRGTPGQIQYFDALREAGLPE